MQYHILFKDDEPKSSREISDCIYNFGDAYTETVRKIIRETNNLLLDYDLFIKNSAILLNSFGMARSGPFKGIKFYQGKVGGPIYKLKACWDAISENLLLARNFLDGLNLNPRSRALVLLDKDSRIDERIRESIQARAEQFKTTLVSPADVCRFVDILAQTLKIK